MLVRSGRATVLLSTVGILGASWPIASGAVLQSADAAPASASPAGHANPAPGVSRVTPSSKRFVITFKDSHVAGASTRREALAGLAKTADATVHGTHMTGSGAEVVQLNKALSRSGAAAFIKAVSRQSGVASVQPDQLVHLTDSPNDPDLPQQWDATDPTAGINLPQARTRSTGGGVTVGVVDTGITQHPDLTPNVTAGYDFISDTSISRDGDARDSDATDAGDYSDEECGFSNRPSNWHGTHVAGTIGAVTNNGVGVAGVAGDARVEPLRALGACGAGYSSDIADAMMWGAGVEVPGLPANPNPVQVLNLSEGIGGACTPLYQGAVDAVRARGVTVVAAAGNTGQDASQATPASCQGVISVAASTRNGGLTPYSNYGPAVDITAPGDDILSTVNEGTQGPTDPGYGVLSGTSMAAPHVAGVAALLKSQDPSLTPDQIEARIKESARPMPQECPKGCGAGLLDAAAAVGATNSESPGTPTQTPTGTATTTPAGADPSGPSESPTNATSESPSGTPTNTNTLPATLPATPTNSSSQAPGESGSSTGDPGHTDGVGTPTADPSRTSDSATSPTDTKEPAAPSTTGSAGAPTASH